VWSTKIRASKENKIKFNFIFTKINKSTPYYYWKWNNGNFPRSDTNVFSYENLCEKNIYIHNTVYVKRKKFGERKILECNKFLISEKKTKFLLSWPSVRLWKLLRIAKFYFFLLFHLFNPLAYIQCMLWYMNKIYNFSLQHITWRRIIFIWNRAIVDDGMKMKNNNFKKTIHHFHGTWNFLMFLLLLMLLICCCY
jgi:hypothetical protein